MASTSQLWATYSPDTCMFCHQSLHITTGDPEPDSDTGPERGVAETVIDDVELYCGLPGSGPSGHHTHWTCLIDHAKQARSRGVIPIPTPVPPGGTPTSAITSCVVCGQNVLDAFGRFIVDVRNEGGETRGFDFGEEEVHLDSHPNQVHVRAFHDLVAAGDYNGTIDLIAEHDVDVHCRYGSDSLTALQKAMFNGDTSGVEFLRSLGATV
ncbi:hypothetical protein JVU11DRAFT_2309 [Chiua virens]|nr:hypothetical protein JVU11DRAFT_2309 [Chiua virens]